MLEGSNVVELEDVEVPLFNVYFLRSPESISCSEEPFEIGGLDVVEVAALDLHVLEEC